MVTYSTWQNDNLSAPCILSLLCKGLRLRPEKCIKHSPLASIHTLPQTKRLQEEPSFGKNKELCHLVSGEIFSFQLESS